MRDHGEAALFPDLKLNSRGCYGPIFSVWFGRFLGILGIKAPGVSFQSFRHTFRDALREGEVGMEAVWSLRGWSSGSGRVDARYGVGLRPKTLYLEIRKVKFPGLDLSHLYDDGSGQRTVSRYDKVRYSEGLAKQGTEDMAKQKQPPFIPQILAQNLTRLRKRAGYKQTEFAKLCGMSKQRLWYYEHAYKGRVLPAQVAIDVSGVLERAGLSLEEIASISLLPETSEITLPPPVLPEPSGGQILEVLQDVRALLLEIRDSGQKAWEGRPPRRIKKRMRTTAANPRGGRSPTQPRV